METKLEILFDGVKTINEYGEISNDVEGLRDIALKNFPYNDGDVNLLLAVIELGILNKDFEFINGDVFNIYCQTIGLDPDMVRFLAIKIMESDDE